MFPLNDEKDCVGLRQGSDMVDEVNGFLEECRADGTMETLAEEYSLEEAILR